MMSPSETTLAYRLGRNTLNSEVGASQSVNMTVWRKCVTTLLPILWDILYRQSIDWFLEFGHTRREEIFGEVPSESKMSKRHNDYSIRNLWDFVFWQVPLYIRCNSTHLEFIHSISSSVNSTLYLFGRNTLTSCSGESSAVSSTLPPYCVLTSWLWRTDITYSAPSDLSWSRYNLWLRRTFSSDPSASESWTENPMLHEWERNISMNLKRKMLTSDYVLKEATKNTDDEAGAVQRSSSRSGMYGAARVLQNK